MRVVTKTVKCDRCGKILKSGDYQHAVTIGFTKQPDPEQEWMKDFLGPMYGIGGEVKDFCADCTKSFYEWLENK